MIYALKSAEFELEYLIVDYEFGNVVVKKKKVHG